MLRLLQHVVLLVGSLGHDGAGHLHLASVVADLVALLELTNQFIWSVLHLDRFYDVLNVLDVVFEALPLVESVL